MRKGIILILLVFLSITFFAQERVSAIKPVFAGKASSELKKATGWMYNPEGKWVSLKNTIPVHISSEHNSLLKYEKRGLGVDNFITYEFRFLTVNGKEYISLIKYFRDGYYRYSNIEEDWNPTKSCIAYVFEKNELEKFMSLQDGAINLISIDLVSMVTLRYEDKPLKYLHNKINIDAKQLEGQKLIFHLAPYKDKNIVQFQIYSMKGLSVSGVVQQHILLDSQETLYMTDNLFKHCYYESDYKSFMGFLYLGKSS